MNAKVSQSAQNSSILAPIEEEILFSIAMGFNPWELKKDWNEKRDEWS